METSCKWAYICLVDDWGESKGCKVKYSRNAKRKAFIGCIINIILLYNKYFTKQKTCQNWSCVDAIICVRKLISHLCCLVSINALVEHGEENLIPKASVCSLYN